MRSLAFAIMDTVVVRLWVPDRPGALGVVAGAIGAAGADVVAIDILERGGGSAIDEITVVLPVPIDATPSTDRLVASLAELEGVAVEDIRPLTAHRADRSDFALECAARLAEADDATVLAELCAAARELLEAEWAAVLTVDGSEPLAAAGEVPDLGWLSAFVQGSSHLTAELAPGDVAFSKVGGDAMLVVGRSERPVHARERHQVTGLARIAAAAVRRRMPVSR
jgi:hypothetical protein